MSGIVSGFEFRRACTSPNGHDRPVSGHVIRCNETRRPGTEVPHRPIAPPDTKLANQFSGAVLGRSILLIHAVRYLSGFGSPHG
jgi:hypothetical protein